MAERTRPAWEGSTRRDRLPANWKTELRPAAEAKNPQHVCHRCGLPGGSELDHIISESQWPKYPDGRPMPGLDYLDNLDWIHNRADYDAGRSRENCHGRKSGAEGAAARTPLRRPPERHPALG